MMYSSLIRIFEIFMMVFVVTISAKGFLQPSRAVKIDLEQIVQVVNNNESQSLKMTESFCDDEEKDMKKGKLIKVNVGGEIFIINRDILTNIQDSKFASMINGNCEDIPAIDCDGNIFLDYNPTIFHHLLEQLRILKHEDSPIFYPPYSLLLIPAFQQMMKEFGLQIAPVSDDDIITLNVGGEIFVTRRRILTRISNSKLTMIVSSYQTIHTDANGYVFLDCDARLFRHLLSQLRSSACETTCTFQSPTPNDAEAFNAMLISLGLVDSIPTTTSCPPATETLLISQNAKITASNFCNIQRTSCAASITIAEQVKDILYPDRPNNNYWNSRGYAPQYIQLELDREQTVSNIRLQVAQTPNSQTSHKLLVGSQANELKEVKTIAGFTNNYEWINLTFHPPLQNVRFLRLNTISSPSWVAWFKFLVYNN